MLTVAFDESTMSWTQVQLWYNRFKESREDGNIEVRPCRPGTLITDENIEAVKEIKMKLILIADDVDILFGFMRKF